MRREIDGREKQGDDRWARSLVRGHRPLPCFWQSEMDHRSQGPFDWGFLFQWMVATTMGWLLGKVLFPGLTLVVTGLAMSGLQWFILQHRLPKAWRWIAASMVGWLAGGLVVTLLLPEPFEFLSGLLFGLTTGLGQWTVLRREVLWAGWWIPVSALAWTTGLNVLPGIMLSGVMIGLVSGIALEILLRHPKPRQTQPAEV